MYEDLGLEYPCQVWPVNKFEVGGAKVLICKSFKNEKSIIRVGNHGIKGNKLTNYGERNKKLLV